MASHIKKSVQLSALCIAIACVHTQALAVENLEQLDDEMLAESTGEGIAFLPENFSVRMNGTDTANSGEGTYGTGYARIIPVGPLSATATAKGYSKADGWVYGVSLAQSKKDYADNTTATNLAATDWGVPFGGIGSGEADFGREITSWGTAENPWIFKTLTDTTVPNFTGAANSVTYMTLEAPRFHATLPSSGTAASSAYNLKLGVWADFATRTQAAPENGYDGLDNRLRLAVVWDGFSVNGSNINIFQTLDGATTPAAVNVTGTGGLPNAGQYVARLLVEGSYVNKTFNYGTHSSYNKTLGLSGLFRFNSRPTDTIRATTSFGNTTRTIHRLDYAPATNWNTVTETYAGSYSESAALQTNTVTGRVVGTMSAANAGGTVPTSVTHNAAGMTGAGLTMTYDPMYNDGYRGSPNLTNPATEAQAAAGGYKPSYYYRNGTNGVVRGSFYDDGVCSGSTSGTNNGNNNNFGQCQNREGFITRRFKVSTTNSWTPPPVKSVIRLNTQEYDKGAGGVYGAGTPALGGGDGWDNVPDFRPNTNGEGVFLYDANINLVLGNLYQPLMLSTDGNNFSIELARIPNVQNIYSRIYQRYPNSAAGMNDGSGTGDGGISYLGNTCNIHKCGTSSGGYQGYNATHSSISIGSTVYDAGTNRLTAYKGLEAYGVSIGELKAGTGLASSNYEDAVQVYRSTRTNWNAFPAWQKAAIEPAINTCGSGVCANHPSLVRTNPYETRYRQNYNNQILGIQTTMPQSNTDMANKINNLMPNGATVSNNFGSVAIDGLMIQHFKFSTTGL